MSVHLWFYQDSVEELRKVFNRLTLIMEGEAAIRFIDPVVFSICLPLWDSDGDGYITEDEALAIKMFPANSFSGKSDITSLDDLAKLAGYMFNGAFSNMPMLKTAHTGKRYSGSSIVASTIYQGYINCTALKRITIDESIKSIERMCFYNCSSLKQIIWNGNETTIGNSAFYGCTSLEDISFPSGITSLESNEIFFNCTSLKDIQLSQMTAIGYRCFCNCVNLKIDVNIPALETTSSQAFASSGVISASNLGKLQTISVSMFSNCTNLIYAIIPDTVMVIEQDVFYKCSSLQYVVCNALTPPTLNSTSVFGDTSCIIYVPDTSVTVYKSTNNWAAFSTRIKPISEKP